MKMNMIGYVICGLVLSVNASAQVLDLQTGRGADLSEEPTFSVDAGLVLGDVKHLGIRGNWKVGDTLLGANLGISDFNDKVTAFGAFGMYQLDTSLPVPLAIRVGYDRSTDSDSDPTLQDFSVEAVSGGPILRKLNWYGSAGFHYLKSDAEQVRVVRRLGRVRVSKSDSDFVVTAGAGATYELSDHATAFAGADVMIGDLYDGLVIGCGVRWSFR